MKLLHSTATAVIAVVSLSFASMAAPASAQAPSPEFMAPLPESVPSDLPRNAKPIHYTIDFTPDMKALTFTGTETIDLVLLEESTSITLHALEIVIDTARLVTSDGKSIALSVEANPSGQTATFMWDKSLPKGEYSLELTYSGKINTQANGLFALDYPDKRTGEEVRGLFTQFEAPDARRFAPMFDEPSYKAVFDLSATVPEELMALGNMPIANEKVVGNGLKKVTFQTSPKMSSYLLFFGLGDFERMAKTADDGTEVGIVGPAGSGEQARYALDSLAPLMTYYGDYFDAPYPLPKLDNIAGPGQSQFFGAMENWGAIFTFESILLEDPAISSARTRQSIFSVQAHEVAHQWFGDIVTMAWWDDLWLNEGFASWLETKATAHFNPDWYPLLSRVDGREAAMGFDAFSTTHPVVQKIRTVSETAQAFDAIAYSKGEAVIAMLEAYAGEDVWRGGIREYISRHKYGNTVSDDLWSAVEAQGASRLTKIAHDFTQKPGIPLVQAITTCKGGKVEVMLAQSEFSRDRKDEVTANPQSWLVPVTVRGADGIDHRTLLEGDSQVSLASRCSAPVIVNAGQLGYFRTLYSPEMQTALVSSFGQLEPIDQMGLLADAFGLAKANYQPMRAALDMLMAVPTSANPVVAQSAAGQWQTLYGQLENDKVKAAVAALARGQWLTRLEELGYESKDGEKLVDTNLRSTLLQVLGSMGDDTVAEQARNRFAQLGEDPRALDGPLKTTWLAIAARNATPAEWQRLMDLAGTTKSATEKQVYYRLLGATSNEALARKALDFAITGKAGTASAGIISAVAQEYPELAFDFVVAHQTEVEPLVDSSGRARFVARLTSSAKSEAMESKLEAYAATLPEDERKPIDRALVGLRDKLANEPRIRDEVAVWIGERGERKN